MLADETGRRVRINGLRIAAIAASGSLPTITQGDGFAALDGVADLTAIRSDAWSRRGYRTDPDLPMKVRGIVVPRS